MYRKKIHSYYHEIDSQVDYSKLSQEIAHKALREPQQGSPLSWSRKLLLAASLVLAFGGGLLGGYTEQSREMLSYQNESQSTQEGLFITEEDPFFDLFLQEGTTSS